MPTRSSTNPTLLALALVIGVATSMIAAMIPARQAARVDPVQALQKGKYQVLTAGESRAAGDLWRPCSAACRSSASASARRASRSTAAMRSSIAVALLARTAPLARAGAGASARC